MFAAKMTKDSMQLRSSMNSTQAGATGAFGAHAHRVEQLHQLRVATPRKRRCINRAGTRRPEVAANEQRRKVPTEEGCIPRRLSYGAHAPAFKRRARSSLHLRPDRVCRASATDLVTRAIDAVRAALLTAGLPPISADLMCPAPQLLLRGAGV